MWGGEAYASEGVAGVRFTYASHDGEEGYPGNVNVSTVSVYDVRQQQEFSLSSCIVFTGDSGLLAER